MDLQLSKALNKKIEEAEFLLEDMEVLLESPRRIKVNPKKGSSVAIVKHRKSKKKSLKCCFCSLVFESKEIIEMHIKVCSSRSSNGFTKQNLNSTDIKGYGDVDNLLTSFLKGAQPTDFMKLIFAECIKRLGITQTTSTIN